MSPYQSGFEFKHSWEDAIRRAMLTRRSESELANYVLTRAAGLPTRSGLQAGNQTVITITLLRCGQPAYGTSGCTTQYTIGQRFLNEE